MTVLDIVCSAIKILGDTMLYDFLVGKTNENYDYYQNEKELLLISYNEAVTKATTYYPLKYKEVLSPKNGEIKYVEFKFNPYKIIEVLSNKSYEICPTKIKTESDIEVTYYYYPKEQSYEEDYIFDGTCVSPQTIVFGVLSEYLTYKGRYQERVTYFDKFLNSLKNATKIFKIKRLRTREWF